MARDGSKLIYDNPEYWCGDIGYRPPGYADFTINTIKEILILLYKPTSVLDIGCAYGFIVGRLRKLGIEAYGLDISSYAIAQALPAIKPFLTKGDVCEMPFPDASFDFVFSSGVLEHLPKDSVEKAISEICRVCERGIIGVSCADDPTTHEDDDSTHQVNYTLEQWQRLFPPKFQVLSDSEANWRGFAIYRLYQYLRDGYICLT